MIHCFYKALSVRKDRTVKLNLHSEENDLRKIVNSIDDKSTKDQERTTTTQQQRKRSLETITTEDKEEETRPVSKKTKTRDKMCTTLEEMSNDLGVQFDYDDDENVLFKDFCVPELPKGSVYC